MICRNDSGDPTPAIKAGFASETLTVAERQSVVTGGTPARSVTPAGFKPTMLPEAANSKSPVGDGNSVIEPTMLRSPANAVLRRFGALTVSNVSKSETSDSANRSHGWKLDALLPEPVTVN